MSTTLRLLSISSLAFVSALGPSMVGCGGGSGTTGSPEAREVGQSDFTSAPLAGQGGGSSFGAANDSAGAAAPSAGASKGTTTRPEERKVEETDLYRLDGNRLYYLNSYRGLMVFDVTNVDQPRLLGRSAIFGSPVDMVVHNGIATVVVGDWYGSNEDGSPFHGSVVRGLDATDPANIKVTGEARLGGWVRDTRVVGDVLYAVSEDYGWYYGMGWRNGYAMGGGDMAGPIGPGGYGGGGGPKVLISSVNIANGAIAAKGSKAYDGFSGAFYVTSTAIIMAHDLYTGTAPNWGSPSGKSQIEYVDITDPAGSINVRSTFQINGQLQGWGTDNGRWNLDYQDGVFAHVIACAPGGCYGGNNGSYVLSTVNFMNPDAPALASELSIPASGYSAAARFDAGRMYLSPSDSYGPSGNTTPVQIFDLSVPTAPKLAGQTEITGAVWNFQPAGGGKFFALGNDYNGSSSSSHVSLRYIDASDATNPKVIGTSSFGDGWAWTPAAQTFKAFTMDAAKGMVVIPFSGWDDNSYEYNNGLQLIEFTPTSIATKGAAKTKGWVERGIFANGRLLSLSDLALSVIDYTDHANPKVVNEVTLARNVVSAQPLGPTIAALSTDWWGYDQSTSELRVMDVNNAEENVSDPNVQNVTINGTNARIFRNGDFAYIVTELYPNAKGGPYNGNGPTPQVQVVDLSGGHAVLRGKIALPPSTNSYYYGGYYGCYYYDWYDGSDAIQVNGNALAFRRWRASYELNGVWTDEQKLFVVDLQNPDAPTIASTLVTQDQDSWWGNMRAVGDTLYTTHYEWVQHPNWQNPMQGVQYSVRYYLDRIDLSDRAHPKVGSKINVPGVLVGASDTDPSLLYMIDYRWYGTQTHDELAVVKIAGNKAYLQSTTQFDGYVGNVFVRNSKAYMTSERYPDPNPSAPSSDTGPKTSLHQLDLTNPKAPIDRASAPVTGWGWLLGVEGDRAIVTSGWGSDGIDIFKLTNNAAPVYDQFARTRGWWSESLARQGDQLFLASGYWGVQTVTLK